MRFLICLCLSVSLIQMAFTQVNSQAQDRLDVLANLLENRIQDSGDFPSFPPLVYQPDLPANARYANGQIWIGTIQADYHTTGDSLSILYHEYHHFCQELQGQYVICEDSSGQIPQWSTGELYEYIPTKEEIERDLAQAMGPWLDRYDEERRKIEVGRLKRDLSRPRKMLFVYAPSRLAEAEIDAYQVQLKGESMGFYQLSSEARKAIYRRLDQLQDTLKRRKAYEQLHGLHPAGCKNE